LDIQGIRESIIKAISDLEKLKQQIEGFQQQIIGDFERKMDLLRFTQVNKDLLKDFFEEPYVIVPKRANEWYVIAPKTSWRRPKMRIFEVIWLK
jgi:hypothetical protein